MSTPDAQPAAGGPAHLVLEGDVIAAVHATLHHGDGLVDETYDTAVGPPEVTVEDVVTTRLDPLARETLLFEIEQLGELDPYTPLRLERSWAQDTEGQHVIVIEILIVPCGAREGIALLELADDHPDSEYDAGAAGWRYTEQLNEQWEAATGSATAFQRLEIDVIDPLEHSKAADPRIAALAPAVLPDIPTTL
jgi:hypothetical protein